jgi:hypothetical protein
VPEIDAPPEYSRPMAYCSTMNRPAAERPSSPARLLAPRPASRQVCRRIFIWATSMPGVTGVMRKNMWNRCGLCCGRISLMTTLSQRERRTRCTNFWEKHFPMSASTGTKWWRSTRSISGLLKWPCRRRQQSGTKIGLAGKNQIQGLGPAHGRCRHRRVEAGKRKITASGIRKTDFHSDRTKLSWGSRSGSWRCEKPSPRFDRL